MSNTHAALAEPIFTSSKKPLVLNGFLGKAILRLKAVATSGSGQCFFACPFPLCASAGIFKASTTCSPS